MAVMADTGAGPVEGPAAASSRRTWRRSCRRRAAPYHPRRAPEEDAASRESCQRSAAPSRRLAWRAPRSPSRRARTRSENPTSAGSSAPQPRSARRRGCRMPGCGRGRRGWRRCTLRRRPRAPGMHKGPPGSRTAAAEQSGRWRGFALRPATLRGAGRGRRRGEMPSEAAPANMPRETCVLPTGIARRRG